MRFLLLTTLLLSSLVALGANGNSNQLPVVQKDESDIISVRRRKLQASSTCPANGLVKVAGSGGFKAWNDTEFRKMVGSGPNYNLIYRHCESCAVSHKDIYYKRLTPIPDNFDFLNLFLNNWNKGPANVLGIDFRMFSSIEFVHVILAIAFLRVAAWLWRQTIDSRIPFIYISCAYFPS